MVTRADFERTLNQIFAQAEKVNKSTIQVNSGKLHRLVGGYLGSNHRMPVCCGVMNRAKGKGDKIISAPPSGLGASLTIEYKLPRS